jgi:hypothetical protein
MNKKPQDGGSRLADKYIVRFPEGMRARIAESAKANKRSMNAEIIARLEASFLSDKTMEVAENALKVAPLNKETVRQIALEFEEVVRRVVAEQANPEAK